MPHNLIWQLEEDFPRETYDQPACREMVPHAMHKHETMNKHFKMKAVWCDGLCEWCFKDEVPENFKRDVFGRGLHGNGAHK